MDSVDERDLRLARRIKFGVHLVIYPMLLGLLAVAWHARAATGETDGRRTVVVGKVAERLPVTEMWRASAAWLARSASAWTLGGRMQGLLVGGAGRLP